MTLGSTNRRLVGCLLTVSCWNRRNLSNPQYLNGSLLHLKAHFLDLSRDLIPYIVGLFTLRSQNKSHSRNTTVQSVEAIHGGQGFSSYQIWLASHMLSFSA